MALRPAAISRGTPRPTRFPSSCLRPGGPKRTLIRPRRWAVRSTSSSLSAPSPSWTRSTRSWKRAGPGPPGPMPEPAGPQKPLTAMSLEQLQLYARELAALFQSERQTRQELEKKQKYLEQKIGELEALNQLFQNYLRQRLETQQAYYDLLDRLGDILADARQVRDRAAPPGPAA